MIQPPWPATIVAEQVVSLVFLLASIAKLTDRETAFKSVLAYDLLPFTAAHILSQVLPWVELAIAMSLMVGFLSSKGAASALVLLIVFSLAQILMLLHGRDVPCGCFGGLLPMPVRWANVLTNLALSTGCALIWMGTSIPLETEARAKWLPLYCPASLRSVFEVRMATSICFVSFLCIRHCLANATEDRHFVTYHRQLAAALKMQGYDIQEESKGT